MSTLSHRNGLCNSQSWQKNKKENKSMCQQRSMARAPESLAAVFLSQAGTWLDYTFVGCSQVLSLRDI